MLRYGERSFTAPLRVSAVNITTAINYLNLMSFVLLYKMMAQWSCLETFLFWNLLWRKHKIKVNTKTVTVGLDI